MLFYAVVECSTVLSLFEAERVVFALSFHNTFSLIVECDMGLLERVF